MTIEQVAEICHEANKCYCEQAGDYSQVHWALAADWQKQSIINGVKFKLENPDSTPENSHENWLKEKQETGWKFGIVKDVDKKEHPCFLPYDELPEDQQAKDYLFTGIVKSLTKFIISVI